jgi:hypothetical protein
MLLVHQRAALFERPLGVEHEGQGLVVDIDFFSRVFRLRARVGDHGGDPFAGIARDLRRHGPARHVGRVEARKQRVGCLRKLGALEYVMDAGHFQRCRLVNCLDVRGRVRAGDQRDVARVGQVDISDEIALAGHETAVLAYAAVRRDEVEMTLAHVRNSVGRLAPRMRSAASVTASTICA